MYATVWLTNLIVEQLVVKPHKNVLVAQPISHNKKWPTSGRIGYITPAV